MNKPIKEDIEKFRDFDAEAFEHWLRLGLEGLLLDQIGVRNFRPVEYCIFGEHNLSADLRVIYEAFPSAEKRAAMRAAIARLISHLPSERRYAPIFRTLFDLAAAVQAFEVLGVLPARGEGFLTLERESPDVPSLYRAALDLVAELRDQSADGRACIERLIGTPGSFEPTYARVALITLCKMAPADFIEHMNLLRPSLNENFQKFHPTQEGVQSLVTDIVKAVGLNVIQNDWKKLHVVEIPGQLEATDNWFRDVLLTMVSGEVTDQNVKTIAWKKDTNIRVRAASTLYAAPILTDQHTARTETNAPRPSEDDREPYPELLDERITDQEKEANVRWGWILLGIKRGAALLGGVQR